MSFIKSLFFGSEGSYKVLGIPVKFENARSSSSQLPTLDGAGFISKLASKCINSNAFRWITQGYAHVFVHEMSHAIASRSLTKENPEVHIFKDLCSGETDYSQENTVTVIVNGVPVTYVLETTTDTPAWKQTVVSVAGPMGNIAFSTCKLLVATVFKSYLSWPVALALGGGAVIWMSGELLYAYVSASKQDSGDFGQIANRGKAHLALASTALVTECALGILAVLNS